MAYVRISFMTALPGKAGQAVELNRELVEFYRGQKGCLESHLLQAWDESGELGRVTFWESESAADAAATLDHSMYLRSRLHLLVEKGHQERSFQTG